MTAICVIFSGLFVLTALPVWSITWEVFGSWPPDLSLYFKSHEITALMWASWVLCSIFFVIAVVAFWVGFKHGWEKDSIVRRRTE